MNTRMGRIVGLAPALVAASLYGCMTVEKVHQPPATLQENIRSGELARPGDRIAVVTASQGERIMVVTEVDQDSIRGDGVEVSIDEVVALERRKVSAGNTALAALGVVYVMIPLAIGGVFLIGTVLGL